MRKLPLILLFIIALSGCAFLKDQKASFDACMEDAECKASAQAWQDRTEVASTIIASAVPVPGAAAAPKVLGYLALGIAGLIGGNALRKKKQEASSVNQ
jgi:hypothetical protein